MKLLSTQNDAAKIISTVATAANYFVSSQSGSTPIFDCAYTNGVWDICQEHTCNGKWQKVGYIPTFCIPVQEHADPCDQVPKQLACRRVTGWYTGWEARNGLLHAYYGKDRCWLEPRFVFTAFTSTYAWTALRGDDGSWINIDHKVSWGDEC